MLSSKQKRADCIDFTIDGYKAEKYANLVQGIMVGDNSTTETVIIVLNRLTLV